MSDSATRPVSTDLDQEVQDLGSRIIAGYVAGGLPDEAFALLVSGIQLAVTRSLPADDPHGLLAARRERDLELLRRIAELVAP